jgi:sulfate transport system substrate-binding protein
VPPYSSHRLSKASLLDRFLNTETIMPTSFKLTAILLFTTLLSTNVHAEAKLLNVSYDVTREFYKDFNLAFTKHWQQKTGETPTINQSHGGSSKQARAVVDGLEADIISMNQATDIDILHDRGRLIPKDWQKRLPKDSSPTASTTVFLVRKGNPKNIKDWDDLIKPGVAIVVPNPKTSGNGRYSYLAGWGYVIKKGGDEAKAKEFVTKLFKNVPVLDAGGRGATTTFVQRGIGDALLTFENEVALIKKELGNDQFDVVYPSVSVLAENPISLVDKVVDKHKSRALAQAYLDFHYSEEGQEIAVKHYLRPRVDAVAAKHKGDFKQLDLFTIDEVFGGWANAQKTHFADGGIFDQIYLR